VSKNLALLAVFFNLVECSIDEVNKLNLVAALFLSGDPDYLKAFDPHQMRALAYLALRLHAYGYAISLVFFGFVCLILGNLLFRSGYFPRTLGVLMTITGLSYLTIGFTQILVPAYAGKVFPIMAAPAFIGELSLCLWLTVKGVNLTKWNEKALLASQRATSRRIITFLNPREIPLNGIGDRHEEAYVCSCVLRAPAGVVDRLGRAAALGTTEKHTRFD